MEAVAKLRNCPMSPRKMRLVVDLIRGKKVNHALHILKFTKKEASGWLEKLLLSAINNWEQKHGEGQAEEANLIVKTAFVDGGTVIKRFQPAPHGRAHRIRKRRNHVTIVVGTDQKTSANNL
ncbi:MAG: 50S ribosomal protein L22 [Saprospiraceae bacterium]|jgi:large subunit ribosomal protein L22|nr:50S ribosomal protein L22 [Saprospiraceae bacterium]MBK7797089.1 50S ribosomal protein L22 [Saprospiraceae bacterium]MBK8152104.1 50S ribosomal protein L22 [Saprospiraceae bacterium]MBK9377429.1 50S ribosomal protein L22 [Saprospiraceae bacterium]MBL0259521.1 50S ribosomal protein L22 [Saprospiraceae bacterium]